MENNEKLKIFGIFMGSFAAGFGISAFIFKKKYETQLDEEVAAIQNDYDQRLLEGVDKEIAEKIASEYAQNDILEPVEDENDSKMSKIEKLAGKKKTPVHIDKVDYNKKSTKGTKNMKNNVRIIDLQEYSENPDGYELLSYSYFKTDKVFVDIDSEEVNLNIAAEIGDEILEGHTDVETLYLALDDRRELVEMIIHETSYAEWMMEDHE